MKLSSYKTEIKSLLNIEPKVKIFYIRNIFSWEQKATSKFGDKKEILLKGIGFLLTQEARISENNEKVFSLIKLTISKTNIQWCQILKCLKIDYEEKNTMLENFRKKIRNVTSFKIQTAKNIKEYRFIEAGYNDPFDVKPIFPSAIKHELLEKLGKCQWLIVEDTKKVVVEDIKEVNLEKINPWDSSIFGKVRSKSEILDKVNKLLQEKTMKPEEVLVELQKAFELSKEMPWSQDYLRFKRQLEERLKSFKRHLSFQKRCLGPRTT
jgi:hypothetical protein